MDKVIGDWKGFEFKMIQEEDKTKILKHMREFMYYPSLRIVGYEKDNQIMDDDHEAMFSKFLNDGHNLSFFAEDKKTGKVAGVRIITAVNRSDPQPPRIHRHPKSKAISDLHAELDSRCKVFERYPDVQFYAEFFGVSVDPEFQNQGIASEMYKRAIPLLKSKGITLAKCGFSGPYSRKAGIKNGYIELGRTYLRDVKDHNGVLLHPNAGDDQFIDSGIFEIK